MDYPKRYYDYSSFLKEKFGEKIYKISVDAGFTCPNIDGKVAVGGCIYCNNKSFHYHNTGVLSIGEQIIKGMKVRSTHFKADKFLVYFQSYTNTYAPVEQLREIYNQALQFPEVVGIAIGTRPDEVDEEKLDLLEEIAEKTFVSIEYGVQSANNETLHWINRAHTYEDFVRAMEWTNGRNLHCCAHMMLGFPQETREEMLAIAGRMNNLKVSGVKLHNLMIVEGTRLAKMYRESPFPLFEYDDYLELVCDILELLNPKIVIERLFATTSRQFLIAPKWGKSPGAITNDITKKLKQRNSYQGSRYGKSI